MEGRGNINALREVIDIDGFTERIIVQLFNKVGCLEKIIT